MNDFSVFNFPEQGPSSRRVYYKGSGPAVIVMHELPGMIPECVDLARRIAAAGFTVYLPLLFGEPDRPFSLVRMLGFTAQLCISHEFYCFAKHESSPITNWLRDLCRKVHQDCDDRGVGVIGMCLTGGFVLSLMADESVIAPVISQPSLPLGITPAHKAALGVSEPELNKARSRDVPLLALRFSDDKTSPRQRWETLQQKFGGTSEVIREDTALCWKRGNRLETIEISSQPGNPFGIDKNAHAILTLEYRDEADHPTHVAFQRVVEFLQEQFAKK
jgi:dienelactone hydrolase